MIQEYTNLLHLNNTHNLAKCYLVYAKDARLEQLVESKLAKTLNQHSENIIDITEANIKTVNNYRGTLPYEDRYWLFKHMKARQLNDIAIKTLLASDNCISLLYTDDYKTFVKLKALLQKSQYQAATFSLNYLSKGLITNLVSTYKLDDYFPEDTIKYISRHYAPLVAEFLDVLESMKGKASQAITKSDIQAKLGVSAISVQDIWLIILNFYLTWLADTGLPSKRKVRNRAQKILINALQYGERYSYNSLQDVLLKEALATIKLRTAVIQKSKTYINRHIRTKEFSTEERKLYRYYDDIISKYSLSYLAYIYSLLAEATWYTFDDVLIFITKLEKTITNTRLIETGGI